MAAPMRDTHLTCCLVRVNNTATAVINGTNMSIDKFILLPDLFLFPPIDKQYGHGNCRD